jgi:hypothetical protein
MNQAVLISACQKLGYKYILEKDTLTITDIDPTVNMHGEYAIKVVGNKVTYNTFYLKNARAKVDSLQSVFFELNVKYSEESIIREFKKQGWTFKSNDKFKPSMEEKISFYMVGRSKLKDETEPLAQIKFTIMKDGSFVTDSNYIPKDIHELADIAMTEIEKILFNQRNILPKEIPLKYKNKAFCSPKTKITTTRK